MAKKQNLILVPPFEGPGFLVKPDQTAGSPPPSASQSQTRRLQGALTWGPGGPGAGGPGATPLVYCQSLTLRQTSGHQSVTRFHLFLHVSTSLSNKQTSSFKRNHLFSLLSSLTVTFFFWWLKKQDVKQGFLLLH